MPSQTEISQLTPDEQTAPTQPMLERVFSLAVEVLGNEASVLAWLRTPHAVWGKAPVLMIQTRQGLRTAVEEFHALRISRKASVSPIAPIALCSPAAIGVD